MQKYKNYFVGIDFSKEKFDAALTDDSGNVLSQNVFENRKNGFGLFLKWLKKETCNAKSEHILVCGEHTGVFSIYLCDFMYSKGFRVALESALQIKRSSGLVRGKSDPADAIMIAAYARRHKDILRFYTPMSSELREIEALYNYREDLIKHYVRLKNQLSSGSLGNIALINRSISKDIKDLQQRAKKYVLEINSRLKRSPELSKNHAILTSIPGIGVLTSCALIIATNNFTRFGSARKLMCHAGVAPFHSQSGSSIDTPHHVSGFADHKLKGILSEAAQVAIMHNQVIKRYDERLRAKGKHLGVRVNNVRAKLLTIAMKLIQDQKMFDPNYEENKRNQARESRGHAKPQPTAASAQNYENTLGVSPAAGADSPVERLHARHYSLLEKYPKFNIFSEKTPCVET